MDMSSSMEDVYGNYYFESSAPRFFKKLLDQSVKLDIPRKFVIQHGTELLSSGEVIYLKVPCGAVWKLGLERDGKYNMWFRNGWLEFAKSYDIKHGYLLVFTYRGSSKFDVVIFDRSGCEIRYPVKPCRDKGKDNVNHGMFSPKTEEIDVGVSEDVNLLRTKFASSSKPKSGQAGVNKFQKSKKGGNAKSDEKSMEEIDVEVSEDVNLWTNFASSSKPRSGQARVGEFQKSRKGGNAKSDEKFMGNFEKAKRGACTPEPTERDNSIPSFTVVMCSSYVCNNYSLNVPGKFMKKYFGPNDCLVKLSTQASRYWIVQCNFILREDATEAKIQRGWKEFVQDNKLVIGDTCVFELIRSAQVYFQVSILRATKNINFGSSIATRSGSTNCSKRKIKSSTSHEYEAKRIKRDDGLNFNSKYPFFKVILTASYLKRSNVTIETSFARKYLKKKEQFWKLKVGDKLWDVKAFFRKSGSVLSAGWLDFMRDNSLRAGDICMFELIKKEDIVLDVSILRGK